VNLTVSVQHPVKAAFRTDIKPAIGEDRHDLAWRKCREFRFVASQQDPLAFLLTEAVSHVPATALAPVNAITVTSKLTAPALQRREPHGKQQGQFTSPGTIGHALVKDLQGLPAIVRRGQSSPSSPQKA
jgi:hypothetical protein